MCIRDSNNHCTLHLNGFFLRHGKLRVKLDYDLASPLGNYTSSADLGPVSLKELNSVFIPFANIQLKSMVLHEGHIKFHGNSKGINGNGRIIYDKLKVLILKPNSKSHKTKKQKFVSFFANIFAVRAHNRIGKREVLATQIHVSRKRRQPFGNLMWECLFEAIKKITLKVPAKDLKVEM